MTTKRLVYFDTPGIGESIRYLLHYGGIKFEDVRLTVADWEAVKPTTPYGTLPVFEDGDRRIHQSLAIAKYLGTTLGLVSGDAWNDARLDAIAHTINDFLLKVLPYYKEPDATKRAAIKRELETEVIDFYFSRFEKEIKENGGYFGGKLTWADFVLVAHLEGINSFLGLNIEKDYPAVNTLVAKIKNLPNIKAYLTKRKPFSISMQTYIDYHGSK